MVVLSVRYKFYTKTSEKREVSQDLQDCSLSFSTFTTINMIM